MEVRMYSDYYPYGLVINEGANNYRYGYQGQYAEKDPETDWNAFELRMYDSKIARWLTIDPEAEFWSPYIAMGNDPIGLADPTGGKTDDWVQYKGDDGVTYTKWDDRVIDQKTATEFYGGTAQWLGVSNIMVSNMNGIQTWALNADKTVTLLSQNQTVQQNNRGRWGTAIGLTVDWALGIGAEDRAFVNDAVANSFRDARVVKQARNFWYAQVNAGNKTIYDGVTDFLGRKAWTGGNFGVKGLIAAGLDPIEQFVGSFTPEIRSDGHNLTFIIQNTTSFKSLMYGRAPDWRRSTWAPGGNMSQTYIFTEPISFNRIR